MTGPNFIPGAAAIDIAYKGDAANSLLPWLGLYQRGKRGFGGDDKTKA
jgi:hypothetical protein